LRAAALAEVGPAGVDAVRDAFESGGAEAGRSKLAEIAPRSAAGLADPRRTVVPVAAPDDLVGALRNGDEAAAVGPWVQGRRTLSGERRIDAVVVLEREPEGVAARIWTERITDDLVESTVRDTLSEVVRAEALLAAGLTTEQSAAIDRAAPKVAVYSPRAASGGAVSVSDRMPALLGFVAGMLLWSATLSGASILMNSVMEEKSNRVLEVLLTSATTTEILGGKVLGVALITATVLGVWSGLGATFLNLAAPGVGAELFSLLLKDGLLAVLLVFLVGGYLMYAVLFAAIGAFCETPRDAQTLLGPVMMVMLVPVLVMQIAIRTPDAPVVKTLSWIPLFTPFLMSARAPSHPPMIELVGGALGMALTAALMIWLGGKAFRAGALSTGRFDWRTAFARLTGRA
jgi:ABC-2 type transport system permease protein